MDCSETKDYLNWTEDEIDRIQAKKPSERTEEEWFFLAYYAPSTMEEKGFPFDRMTAEDWKEYILDNPITLQYDPPVEALLKILKKEDFDRWDSYDICQALLFDGEWLAEKDLLPLEKIMQEDFDDSFGAEVFTSAGEFWDVAPGYFPNGFPPHIKLPYPPLDDNEGK